MVRKRTKSAILLVDCPDQKGLIARVTGFVGDHGGNIIYLDQMVDTRAKRFYMRLEWDLTDFRVKPEMIEEAFAQGHAVECQMRFQLFFSWQRPRLALYVSKQPHCLFDILARWQSGELDVDIPIIISNHEDLAPIARQYGIAFQCLPITPENKTEQERHQLQLLTQHKIDLVVLARYMQILSADFIAAYPQRIINIHHSFLPAFPGAKPYHSAYRRGVKIIGATSHYVTQELDAGPIIEQDVVHLKHKYQLADLIRHGRDLEKTVLSKAIWHHIRRKVLVHANRTIVFP